MASMRFDVLGIGNAIVGSAALLALSSVLGIPLGIATGIYLTEVGSALSQEEHQLLDCRWSAYRRTISI